MFLRFTKKCTVLHHTFGQGLARSIRMSRLGLSDISYMISLRFVSFFPS